MDFFTFVHGFVKLYMDFSNFLHEFVKIDTRTSLFFLHTFVKIDTRTSLFFYIHFSKLIYEFLFFLHGFVKIDTWISLNFYMNLQMYAGRTGGDFGEVIREGQEASAERLYMSSSSSVLSQLIYALQSYRSKL